MEQESLNSDFTEERSGQGGSVQGGSVQGGSVQGGSVQGGSGRRRVRQRKCTDKTWYYSFHGYFSRGIRGYRRHNNLKSYVPVKAPITSSADVMWPQRVRRERYKNAPFTFKKQCTVADLSKEMDKTAVFFYYYRHKNRYEEASFFGLIVVYHLVLLLRPDENPDRSNNALLSFPSSISGKICHPEGDLLLLPNTKMEKRTRNLTPVCYALRYLEMLMEVVYKMPDCCILPRDLFDDGNECRLRREEPTQSQLRRSRLYSSDTHSLQLAHPNMIKFSMFYKPLFSSKYVKLTSEKTRYAVEVLQLAFVAFLRLADVAMFSKEYGFALFLVQNMTLICRYLDILVPLEELKQYYTHTMTKWYRGRVYYYIGSRQIPSIRLRKHYRQIKRSYNSWSSSFYCGLENEVLSTLPERYKEVDRSTVVAFPEMECLYKSAECFVEVQIPQLWKYARFQHDYTILFYCNYLLHGWSDQMTGGREAFLLSDKRKQLYAIMDYLDFVKPKKLWDEKAQYVALGLLKGKCFAFMALMEVSQLMNWHPPSKPRNYPIDSYSFETMVHLPSTKLSSKDCEIKVETVRTEVPVPSDDDQPTSSNDSSSAPFPGVANTKASYGYGASASLSGKAYYGSNALMSAEGYSGIPHGEMASSTSIGSGTQSSPSSFPGSSDSDQNKSHKTLEYCHSTGMIYRISQIPLASDSMSKALHFIFKAFGHTNIRDSTNEEFCKDLSNFACSNIMFYYVDLQEYEPHTNTIRLLMESFVVSGLDKWFSERNMRMRSFPHIEANIDPPMVGQCLVYLFMTAGLAFYLLYRVDGRMTFRNNARYCFTMMTYQTEWKNCWMRTCKTMSERTELKKRVLLDCHANLRRVPDRCVAVMRSYLHMLPLVNEFCIFSATEDGPVNYKTTGVTEVVFPLDAQIKKDTDAQSASILRTLNCVKTNNYNQLGVNAETGNIKILIGDPENTGPGEVLSYDDTYELNLGRSTAKFPVLEKWSWKKFSVARPFCHGVDDCLSRPCSIEEYLTCEQNDPCEFLRDENPELLDNILKMVRKQPEPSQGALFDVLEPVRLGLLDVINRLYKYIVSRYKRRGNLYENLYIRVCIPGVSSSDQDREAIPNAKSRDTSIYSFNRDLKLAIDHLEDEFIPIELSICKALLILDELLNLDYKMAHVIRGNIP